MVDNKKKSVRKYERDQGAAEPLAKPSGKVPKGARDADASMITSRAETRDESQLRRRLSVDAKIETARTTHTRPILPAAPPPSHEGRGPVSGFAARRQHTKPIPLPDPGPGFMVNEPDEDSSGVPTPKPRLPVSLVPKRLMDERKLMKLPLDHRAGFVLGHIDGVTNLRTMTDVCGMTSEELSEVIDKLVELKVIKLT